MLISQSDAQTIAAKAFVRAGVAKHDAVSAALILTLAEMMGVTTHGLSRVADYCSRIAKGSIDAHAVPIHSAPAPSIIKVDGANGLGPSIAHKSIIAGIAVARTQGAAIVSCHNASHLGALAPYLWQATNAGMAAIITTNTAPMIAPDGARIATIGNNPLGIGIPNPGAVPVLLDMSMSLVSRSRVRAAAASGKSIPDTWATDVNGRPTTDPAKALEGVMQAMGGAKGARLALCLDLLAGGLSGAAMLSNIPSPAADRPQNLGYLFVLINAQMLLTDTALNAQIRTASDSLSAARAIEPKNVPRLPGAQAIAAMQAAQENGLEVPEALFENLKNLASG